jgi:hypothetical protein
MCGNMPIARSSGRKCTCISTIVGELRNPLSTIHVNAESLSFEHMMPKRLIFPLYEVVGYASAVIVAKDVFRHSNVLPYSVRIMLKSMVVLKIDTFDCPSKIEYGIVGSYMKYGLLISDIFFENCG